MRIPGRRPDRAFVQAELLAVLLVITALFTLLAIASTHARQRARVAGSVSNLHKFSAGITSFAADNEDRIVSFSWRAGERRTDRTGYVYAVPLGDMQAAANQAVAIMRWNGGRTDINAINWFPHVSYSHLALAEHLDEKVSADYVVSPNDANRLAWWRSVQNAPKGDNGASFFQLTNRPAGFGNEMKRWPYSSSYEFVPASYSPDARIFRQGLPVIPAVEQASGSHRQFNAGNNDTPFGRRRVSEIAFPGNKVVAFETYGGDLGARRDFFAYAGVRAPMLFGDGSASVRAMAEANNGFMPNIPLSASSTRINYIPELSWEPPTRSGGGSEFVYGVVRFTRSGLRGRDFGGPEVQWVD